MHSQDAGSAKLAPLELQKVYDFYLRILMVCGLSSSTARCLGASTVSCPRQAPTCGVVRCTYDQWFQPSSARRHYCQLPVSGKKMKRFLQFRLGCHKLPTATGCCIGVARACTLCTFCDAGAVGDEKHLMLCSIGTNTGQIC